MGFNPSIKISKFHRTSGYLANLEQYTCVEDYMKNKMGPKHRAKIRNRLRRLEKCFNISYRIHYGEITKTEYDYLFETFEHLIKRRFTQRGEVHQSLDNWNSYKKNSFQYILEKKASLFVIYDNEKPIDICLNYHFQNITNHAIRSYDIDYSKFSLGNVDILKQLEWCFNNNYKIFDLMWGDLEYKSRWCNEVYEYEHHLFLNNGFILNNTIAFLLILLYRFKDFLKEKKSSISYLKIKSIFKEKLQLNQRIAEPLFYISDHTEFQLTENAIKIDIHTPDYAFLRKPTYDFQFTYVESSNDIAVYKMNNQNKLFLIKSEKFNRKIVLK
ncbi:MAG: GNAT family N-acetyltransferase [Maribacter sp.]|nr:GNAT family N-acetyltransferase [Maribacter sp.]